MPTINTKAGDILAAINILAAIKGAALFLWEHPFR